MKNNSKLLLSILLALISLTTNLFSQKTRIDIADILFVNQPIMIDNTICNNNGKVKIYCSSHERSEASGVVYYNFSINFSITNNGLACGPFKCGVSIDSRLGSNSWVDVPSLASGEIRNIILPINLPVGTHDLFIKLDDNLNIGDIVESDELNNLLTFNYTLLDDCQLKPNDGTTAKEVLTNNSKIIQNTKKLKNKIDILNSKDGVTIGGDVNGTGGQFVPWGGSVKLDCKNALPGGGANNQFAYNVTYHIKNDGSSYTGIFENKLYSGAGGVEVRAINSALQLNAGETKSLTTQPYLDCSSTYILTFKFDDLNSVSEYNELNNKFFINYYIDCSSCK
ncbi:MAG: hypothetical protein IPP08_07605 [Chlorobiota bacterium]|nr:hypothetical protein [Chlorobiota bacterium]QQS65646.1 MAG: hypothetical protein IPP08_07605 [Chlorobiota bacterium]